MKLCRDERDNAVLETAINGQAEYLVSRDDDIKGDTELIQQMRASGVQVLTVSQFLRKLEAEGR
jgi:predicted nucleic acid-binding protein